MKSRAGECQNGKAGTLFLCMVAGVCITGSRIMKNYRLFWGMVCVRIVTETTTICNK